ncbi:MAG: hypothetical protein U1E87_10550 [Alphaproteobacteria bacterium]
MKTSGLGGTSVKGGAIAAGLAALTVCLAAPVRAGGEMVSDDIAGRLREESHALVRVAAKGFAGEPVKLTTQDRQGDGGACGGASRPAQAAVSL